MDNEPIQFSQPTSARPPSKRDVLWDELAQLHAQLGMNCRQPRTPSARVSSIQPASIGATIHLV